MREARDWIEHVKNEAQANLLEEIIRLPEVMLREEERARGEKLEEKEE